MSAVEVLDRLKQLAWLHLAERTQRHKQSSVTEQTRFHGMRLNREGEYLMQPFVSGAGGRDRTGMGLLSPRDFKSLASANFATPAWGRILA